MTDMAIWKRILSLAVLLSLLVTPVMQVTAEEIPAELFTEPGAAEVPTAEELPEPSEAPEPEESREPETPEEPAEIPEPETSNEPVEIPEPETSDEPAEIPEPETSDEPAETPGAETSDEPAGTPEEEVPAEPTETVASEEAENADGAILRSVSAAIPIGEALKMPAGETTLVIEGTVVFSMGSQAVLQDDTGGIRMSFASQPDIVPGDILRVTGRRSGGFAVESYEKTGTGELPAREATLAEDCGAVRILVKNAVLGQNSLTQNGRTYQMVGTIPDGLEPGDRADVWGVLLDGVFYADSMVPSESREPEETVSGDWNFYFGQLHAHTGLSDGLGSVEEAFSYASQVENLDFFAVTDHSNAFDNADQGAVDIDGSSISQEWAAGKAAARAVTDETFVGIFGYEMTWQEDLAIGHISTFGTPGWQTRDQDGMDTLAGYLDALKAVPDSVSQFNHPGAVYGDFRNFSEYDPQQDARVHLLEVGGEGSFTAYDAFTTALDAGWHLAPSNNQNNHNGNWGNDSRDRTVVLARELTEAAVYDAVRNYRTYATEDADLQILYHLNDRIMGSIIGESAALTAKIQLQDGSGDSIGRVEVVTDKGEVAASLTVPESRGEYELEVPAGGSYYYLRILRNEQIVAVTAPVWVDAYEDLGITGFASGVEKPEQGEPVLLTLTLYNHEDVPFVVETVTFTVNSDILETVSAPGSVEPVSQLEIPLTYTQETAGTVTITATVTGTIAGLPRTYQQEIRLLYQAPEAEQLDIKEVRSGNPGVAYRIRGYVTAGSSIACNSFPGSIYLQDDTGGIQITDFTREGIQVGTPMEIEGVLRSVGGNLVLAMTDYEILSEDHYRYVPKTMTHQVAMNYQNHGGELLQVEGHVVSVTKTADGRGISRFTLRDVVGDLATVMIEDGIGSSSYGTNELASEVKTGSAVRAMGLLHIDEYGQTVLRVRNCDEVVYVPPVRDPSNPKTGDWLAYLLSQW